MITAVLPTISGIEHNPPGCDEWVADELLNLQATFSEGRLELAVDSASKLLGLGNGLTPSGDDLVIGSLSVLKLDQ